MNFPANAEYSRDLIVELSKLLNGDERYGLASYLLEIAALEIITVNIETDAETSASDDEISISRDRSA